MSVSLNKINERNNKPIHENGKKKYKSTLLTLLQTGLSFTTFTYTMCILLIDQSLPNAVKHLMSFKIDIDIFLNVVVRKAGIKLHLNYFLKIR